jgi:ABC-2 type transport system ATP-binding protein
MHMIPSDLAIDLRAVTKIYRGRVHALRGIDMHVRRGEVFGLLGPNGAGKSTLVKIIMTVIRPTNAQGNVLGNAVGHKPTLARVGYLPENHRFPRYLTGRQTLDFFAALAKVPRAIRKRNTARLLETVGMSDWADKKIGTYSKGMMQRIGLAQAMMNDPDLILLDEPTDGVDPVGRREIRDVLASLRAAGKTVFINSHLLSELEMICDRVAILVGGLVASQGTIEELALGKGWYEVQLAGDANGKLTSLLPAIQQSAPRLIHTGDMLQIDTVDPTAIQPVLDQLRTAGLVIRRVQVLRPSLEDLFMEAVKAGSDGGRALPGAKL